MMIDGPKFYDEQASARMSWSHTKLWPILSHTTSLLRLGTKELHSICSMRSSWEYDPDILKGEKLPLNGRCMVSNWSFSSLAFVPQFIDIDQLALGWSVCHENWPSSSTEHLEQGTVSNHDWKAIDRKTNHDLPTSIISLGHEWDVEQLRTPCTSQFQAHVFGYFNFRWSVMLLGFRLEKPLTQIARNMEQAALYLMWSTFAQNCP